MPVETSDEDLLAAFQQGDVRAFETLLRRHRTPLTTFIARLLGDRQRAEDLAQETFLRIVRGASAWQHRARFRTWMLTIARNLCVDEARRGRVRPGPVVERPAEEGDAAAHDPDAYASTEAGPDRGAESARLRPLLQQLLLTLPLEQREVFLLRELSGLSFVEIGELIDANPNTVKSRMRYALEALRKGLLAAGVGADVAEPEPTPVRRVGGGS